jgi:hypothetical protein
MEIFAIYPLKEHQDGQKLWQLIREHLFFYRNPVELYNPDVHPKSEPAHSNTSA